MNLDDLTIKQLKQIRALYDAFEGSKVEDDNRVEDSISASDKVVGTYVIVRSRNEGVNFGKVESYDSKSVSLLGARRLWYHKPKAFTESSWYEGVAYSGLDESSKISAPVIRKVIVEDYSITSCSEEAAESILNFKTHVD